MNFPFILWVITFVLFCIVVIQVFYLIFLSYIPTKRTQQRRAEPARQAVNAQATTNPALSVAGLPASNAPVASYPTPVPTSTMSMPRVQTAPPPTPRAQPAPVSVPTPLPAPATTGEMSAAGSMISDVGKMVVLSGLPDLMEVNLPGSDFGIGRFYNQERKILVVLDEKSISREHALFQYNPQINQYFVTDKSSSYGTYILVNDQFQPVPPEKPQQLFNGDVVQFGNLVKVRFLLSGGTRASVTQL